MIFPLPKSVRLVQLAYSAGKASEGLLWKYLRGEIELEVPLIVTTANPGMENPMSLVHSAAMEQRCKAREIPFLRADVNLYEGMMTAKACGLTRFDFPAFFTKDRVTGSIGKMTQRCTKWCKIAPMDRLARHWMDANMGIPRKSSRIGEKILQKWVGFTLDEAYRISEETRRPKYVDMEYPLVVLKLTLQDLLAWYAAQGLTVPPRSVCNGCFANDNLYFKMLFDTQPSAWAQAVALDEMIRDLSQFGMRDECFIYGGCVPLTELARLGFPDLRSAEVRRCHSGHCWI